MDDCDCGGETMYNVVFRTSLRDSTFHAITWVPFRSKENFDEQYNEKMKEIYKVAEQDISKERAAELCSAAGATLIIVTSKLREI